MDNDRASILNALIKHLDNSFLSRMASGHNLIKLATCICECDRLIELMVEADKPENTDECDRLTEQILSKIGATLQDNGKIRTMASRAGGIHTGKNPPIMDAIAVFAKRQNLSDEPSLQTLTGLIKEVSLAFERLRTERLPDALGTDDVDFLTKEVLQAIRQEIVRDSRLREIAAEVGLELPGNVVLEVSASQEFDAIAKAYADDGVNWPFGKLSDLILKKTNEVYGDRDDPHYSRSRVTKLMLTIQGIERAIAEAKEMLPTVNKIENFGALCNSLSFCLAGLIEKLRSHPSNVQPRSLSGIICEVANRAAGESSEDARAEVTRAVKFFQSIEGAISSSKQSISTLSEQTDIESLRDNCDLIVKHLVDLIAGPYSPPSLSYQLRTRAAELELGQPEIPEAIATLIEAIECHLDNTREFIPEIAEERCFRSLTKELIEAISEIVNENDCLVGIAIAAGLCPSAIAPAIKTAHGSLTNIWDNCQKSLWPGVGHALTALEAIPVDDKWLAAEDSGKNARDRALTQLGIAPSYWESILAEVRDSDKSKSVVTLSDDPGEKILIALREARGGEISAIAARKRILKDVEVWMRAIQMVIESAIVGDLDDEINARLRGASSIVESSLDKIAEAEKEGIATWWNRPSIFKSDVHYWHYIQKIEHLREAINDLNPEHPEAKIWKRQVPEHPF